MSRQLPNCPTKQGRRALLRTLVCAFCMFSCGGLAREDAPSPENEQDGDVSDEPLPDVDCQFFDEYFCLDQQCSGFDLRKLQQIEGSRLCEPKHDQWSREWNCFDPRAPDDPHCTTEQQETYWRNRKGDVYLAGINCGPNGYLRENRSDWPSCDDPSQGGGGAVSWREGQDHPFTVRPNDGVDCHLLDQSNCLAQGCAGIWLWKLRRGDASELCRPQYAGWQREYACFDPHAPADHDCDTEGTLSYWRNRKSEVFVSQINCGPNGYEREKTDWPACN